MGKNLVMAAFLAMLVLGDCAGAYVFAAEEGTNVQAETQTDEATEGLTDEELAEYYGDSVFVGDSIMVGFRNYCMKTQEDSFVHGIQFLAVGSYSAFNALKPVEDKNVHPMYKGKKYQVWEAIPLMKPKRVFLLLGMNDISILGLEGARDQYKELIDKILEKSPDVEIHILSTTYTLKEEGKGKLNNENLAKYNVLLQELAEENGWGYMDVATPVSDGKGNLAENYCSDGFVHLSQSAYMEWETVLRSYANEQQETEAEKETKIEPTIELEMEIEPITLLKMIREQNNVQNRY